MILTPAQSQIAKCSARFIVVDAGRRFGKSTLIASDMVARAYATKDARIPYYAPTRDDARDIMWAMVKKIAKPIMVDTNEARLEIRIRNKHKGESIILLKGWESVQERGKGVGVKNDYIYLDEVAKYRNFWYGWQEILRPTLTDTRGGATFISTPNGFNHFFDLYKMEDKDEDYKSFHFTSYDNPHIPMDEVDKAKKELTEDRFAQEYLADFRKMEGLVYKDFQRDRHLYEFDEIRSVKKIVGIDFGWRNPAGILFCKIDYDNTYWIVDEYYKTEIPTEELAIKIKQFEPNVTYPDPAEPDRIQILRNAGIYCAEVSKDVDKGVESVSSMFKQNRIKIHKKCVNLISEIESYRYAEKRPDSNEKEEPVKEKDHLCDALRYMVYNTEPEGTNQEELSLYGTTYR